jgi:hypothetical protein
VPSARRNRQSDRLLAVLALGGALLASGLGGCSTTQEKAAAHRAESERILDARAKRQEQKKKKQKNEKQEKGKR